VLTYEASALCVFQAYAGKLYCRKLRILSAEFLKSGRQFTLYCSISKIYIWSCLVHSVTTNMRSLRFEVFIMLASHCNNLQVINGGGDVVRCL